MSHISKLVRDLAPISDGVKKPIFLLRDHKSLEETCPEWRSATFVNRLEMNSRDEIRWIHDAIARQAHNRG